MTEETKKKISESMKGKKKSDLHKIRISQSMKVYQKKKKLQKEIEEYKDREYLRQNCQ